MVLVCSSEAAIARLVCCFGVPMVWWFVKKLRLLHIAFCEARSSSK